MSSSTTLTVRLRPKLKNELGKLAKRARRTKSFLAARKIASQTGIGSSLKFCWVAAAKADVYPRWGPTMEWDTAAAQIILEEAGGQVLEFESREPMRYNKENLRNPSFLALGKLING